MESPVSRSLDGSFRKSNSDFSASGISNSSRRFAPSRKAFKGLKDYIKQVTDLELFSQNLEDWVLENSNSFTHPETKEEHSFPPPFEISELQKLDLALEGVLLQQLCRMPRSSYPLDGLTGDEFLALEDFLFAVANGLWRTFWHRSGPLPFLVSCPRRSGSRFYSVDKAISRGKISDLSGLALISRTENDLSIRWNRVIAFVLYKPDILSGDTDQRLSVGSITEALFHGFRILVSRTLDKFDAIEYDSVFILVLDSNYGGVVKLGGDLSKIELTPSDPYLASADWIKKHSEVCVSPVDQIWNKLGNVNWGDLGTLRLIMATFYSIVQWNGPPRKSIASLASGHGLRVQKRRMECCLLESDKALVLFEPPRHQENAEIVELEDEVLSTRRDMLHLRFHPGEVLLLEDQQQQGPTSFQVQESLVGITGKHCLYSAVSLEYPSELLTLYVGAHPSRLEQSWEDMSLWYQVQRQTKVLNTLRQQAVSSRYLPEVVASGRIQHSGHCSKETPGGRCDHPWCGTPILVTHPIGEPLSLVIARDGPFPADEAVRVCRDMLAALRSASTANVQHGDICPENIMRVPDTKGRNGSRSNNFLHVLTSWGRAVLEDRDSVAVNLQFSSAHALQHGKLCPSSDAESLVYLLLFLCGGELPQPDSIESALQWRETSWSTRSIQSQLGEVSALLKAFVDYVDSLCGTPYPVDYDIWLKRLDAAVDGKGKSIM